MALTIMLNGSPKVFATLVDGASVADVIRELSLKADRVAVELNGDIAERGSWAAVSVPAGSKLEVVQFVGGGAISISD